MSDSGETYLYAGSIPVVMKFLYLVCLASCVLLHVADADEPPTTVNPSECPERCGCAYTNSSQMYVNVYCISLQLEDVPQGTFDNTYKLYLNDNNIKELRKDTFDGFPGVHTLDLKKNAIKNIDTDTFMKLELLNLDLSDNKITSLDFEVILGTLILDRNPLVMNSDAPVSPETPNTYVIKVSFAECELSTVTRSSFSKFYSANYVNLARNNIEDLAGIFQDMKFLREIDLSENKIKKIEGADAFGESVNLRRINLSKNPLTTLDEASLSGLRTLLGLLDISETDLACQCQHEHIKKWATRRLVRLRDTCQGVKCEFCGNGNSCIAPEFCCESGECSRDEKCGAAGLAALPVALLLLLAVALRSGD